MVVLFSREIPKVDNHKIAVKTKVVSPCMDLMVEDSDCKMGIEDSEVLVCFRPWLDCILLKPMGL